MRMHRPQMLSSSTVFRFALLVRRPILMSLVQICGNEKLYGNQCHSNYNRHLVTTVTISRRTSVSHYVARTTTNVDTDNKQQTHGR